MQELAHVDAASGEVRAYLEQLLTAPLFAVAPRRARLMRYLVERTLAGEGDRVNEYSIAVDVFGKPPSFDPRIHSTVRTDVTRLRQKLRQYYEQEGRADPIQLEILPRAYRVAITFRQQALADEPTEKVAAVTQQDEVPPPPRVGTVWRHRRWLWIVAAVVIVMVIAVLGAQRYLIPHHTEHIQSLVVLPFGDFSSDHHSGYLADGLTDELTDDLANVKGLRVMARTTAFQFKDKAGDIREIGRRLNVDASLEGSIDREGNHIHVRAQLNRTADGYHLWSRVYDTHFQDLIAVQRDIARSIADDVQVSRPLAASVARNSSAGLRHDPDPQAHELYLEGMELSNLASRESLRRSAELFQAAVDRDSRFAQAWVALALAHWNGYVWGDNISIETVRSEVQAALDADPGLGLAHAMFGQILWRHDLNWPRAEPEFRLALAQGDGNAEVHARYAAALADRGLFAEAHRQYRIAQELSPLDQEYFTNEGILYGYEGRFADAERIYREVLAQAPKNAKAMAQLSIIKVLSQDCEAADFWRNELAKMSPGSRLVKDLSWRLLVCRGDTATARKLLESDPPPLKFDEAIGYAALGLKERAIECLLQSVERREVGITTLKVTPFFIALHNEPGFIALERRIGLAE